MIDFIKRMLQEENIVKEKAKKTKQERLKGYDEVEEYFKTLVLELPDDFIFSIKLPIDPYTSDLRLLYYNYGHFYVKVSYNSYQGFDPDDRRVYPRDNNTDDDIYLFILDNFKSIRKSIEKEIKKEFKYRKWKIQRNKFYQN